MSISPAAVTGSAGAALHATVPDDFEKGTLGGYGHPAKADLTFGDLLDAVNPLQHLPVISTIYRGLTGDTINPGARTVGGLIYGGPAGALLAGASAGVEEMLAKGPATGGVSTTALAEAGPSPAPATATRATTTPAASGRAAGPAAAPGIALAEAPPTRSGTGKDIRTYLAESMPAIARAGRSDGTVAGAEAAPADPDPGWFAERMLENLERYQALARGRAIAPAAGAALDLRR